MGYVKKSLGQNFLIDKNIINKIINLTDIKNKNIIEIGPGLGAITYEIIKKKPKSLILIEKDDKFYEKLKVEFLKNKSIELFNQDILKFNLEKKIKPNSVIFGNLPYNISSQILVKILRFNKWPPNFTDIIFMFQKELGNKIIGNFKSNNYGRLSILTNYRLKILNKFLISNNCFSPKPKISSIILHFKPKKKFNKIKNLKNLEKVTNILFSNKRKMINKNVKKLFNEKNLGKISFLNLNLRPEEIRPEIYYKLTEIFEKK
tara:strand:+ start:1905 stop:2687 length:783 start_codon:yes stop_codon:yes gene_type:complete